MRPEDFVVGQNFIVDKRETAPTLRNGEPGHATWYQFRIPLDDYEERVGSISDFSSIRFMRMFLTNFKKPVVLRFATWTLCAANGAPMSSRLTILRTIAEACR